MRRLALFFVAVIFLFTATPVQAESLLTTKDFITNATINADTTEVFNIDLATGTTTVWYQNTSGDFKFYRDAAGTDLIPTGNDATKLLELKLTVDKEKLNSIFDAISNLDQDTRYGNDAKNKANYKVAFAVGTKIGDAVGSGCLFEVQKKSLLDLQTDPTFTLQTPTSQGCTVGSFFSNEDNLTLGFEMSLRFECNKPLCVNEYHPHDWLGVPNLLISHNNVEIEQRSDKSKYSLEYYFEIPETPLQTIPNFDIKDTLSEAVTKELLVVGDLCSLTSQGKTITLAMFKSNQFQFPIRISFDNKAIHFTQDFINPIRTTAPRSHDLLTNPSNNEYYLAPTGTSAVQQATSCRLSLVDPIEDLLFNIPATSEYAQYFCRGQSTNLEQGDTIQLLDLTPGPHTIRFLYDMDIDQEFCSATITLDEEGESTIDTGTTGTDSTDAITYADTKSLCESLPDKNACDTNNDYTKCYEDREKARADCDACATYTDDKPPGIWTAVGCLPTDPSDLISKIFGSLSGIMGAFLLICIIWNGFSVMTSRGDPEALKKAQEAITSCVIGFIVLLFAVLIVRIIGVDILKLPWFGPTPTPV